VRRNRFTSQFRSGTKRHPPRRCGRRFWAGRRLSRVFCAVLLGLAAAAADADELAVLGGGISERSSDAQSFTWALDYRHALTPNFGVGASWINQGHVPNHHRDGMAAQLWVGTTAFDPRLSFAAGIGPFYYFDTTRHAPSEPERDNHGWGILYSASARWQFVPNWLVELRLQYTETRRSIDTMSVLLGIGYKFDEPTTDAAPVRSVWSSSTRNEVAFFGGQAVVNDFSSEPSFAMSVEYRRSLNDHFDWTLAWLHEGQPRLARRHGVVSELWLGRTLGEGRWTIGAGIGVDVVVDVYSGDFAEGGRERLAAIFSLTSSYRLTPDWSARATWHRVSADHPFDSDVFLLGIGYNF
jgi:hypothetical protein